MRLFPLGCLVSNQAHMYYTHALSIYVELQQVPKLGHWDVFNFENVKEIGMTLLGPARSTETGYKSVSESHRHQYRFRPRLRGGGPVLQACRKRNCAARQNCMVYLHCLQDWQCIHTIVGELEHLELTLDVPKARDECKAKPRNPDGRCKGASRPRAERM